MLTRFTVNQQNKNALDEMAIKIKQIEVDSTLDRLSQEKMKN